MNEQHIQRGLGVFRGANVDYGCQLAIAQQLGELRQLCGRA